MGRMGAPQPIMPEDWFSGWPLQHRPGFAPHSSAPTPPLGESWNPPAPEEGQEEWRCSAGLSVSHAHTAKVLDSGQGVRGSPGARLCAEHRTWVLLLGLTTSSRMRVFFK